jgi:hypothetical protein
MGKGGYPDKIAAVRNAARLLLEQGLGLSASTGGNWPRKYVSCHPAIKTRYTHQYIYQRAQSEDPEVIGGWFLLVDNTIKKYGMLQEDSYNFDETSFANYGYWKYFTGCYCLR